MYNSLINTTSSCPHALDLTSVCWSLCVPNPYFPLNLHSQTMFDIWVGILKALKMCMHFGYKLQQAGWVQCEPNWCYQPLMLFQHLWVCQHKQKFPLLITCICSWNWLYFIKCYGLVVTCICWPPCEVEFRHELGFKPHWGMGFCILPGLFLYSSHALLVTRYATYIRESKLLHSKWSCLHKMNSQRNWFLVLYDSQLSCLK